MTAFVKPEHYTSKAALKANLDKGINITDPQPGPDIILHSTAVQVGFSILVTNHPKRDKFAKITKTATGWKVQ